jgi:hypothetical protein
MLPLLTLILPGVLWAQESTVQMLDRLAMDPGDSEAIGALSGKYDPRIIDAFEKAFDAISDPEEKHLIAFNLVDDGVRDQKYFEYLVQQAVAQIDVDAPYPLNRDSDGKEIRGQLNPAFDEWCRNHRRDTDSCARDYLSPMAVTQLALLGDQRSGDILMRGLRSKNILVAQICAGGLGVLGRTDALPIIAERIVNSPADMAIGFAGMLGDYHTPAAEALMDQYIPDKDLREMLKHGTEYGSLLRRRKERGIQ